MTNKETHRYDHEKWLEQLFAFSQNGRQFLDEAAKAAWVLARKGLMAFAGEVRFFFSRATKFDYICGGLSALFGCFATGVALVGFGLLAYQVLLWLMQGVWTAYPVMGIFSALFEGTALGGWMAAPESWIGLQKLIRWLLETTPLSLALIVPGVLASLATLGLMVTATGIRYYQFKNVKHG